jgi:hypothetical protein
MRNCLECKSETTYINKHYNTERWYRCKGEDGFYCRKCYAKLIANPKRTKEYIKKYNDRRTPEYIRKYAKKIDPILKKKINAIYHPRLMRFKGKQISLKENPRIGYCSLCRNNIHNGSAKITHIHHINYHDHDPLKDTIEVCASCHAKITMEGRINND